jgi:ERCC4-type nuclease
LKPKDYVLDHALLVERKTLGDFAASIKDGRAVRQALRLAQALLEHFGSVGGVVSAGSDSLRSVKGIGPRTAQRLVWSIEEPAARYGQATA